MIEKSKIQTLRDSTSVCCLSSPDTVEQSLQIVSIHSQSRH